MFCEEAELSHAVFEEDPNFASGIRELLFSLGSSVVFEVIFCCNELVDAIVKRSLSSIIPEVVESLRQPIRLVF